jgi:hypothetical protein
VKKVLVFAVVCLASLLQGQTKRTTAFWLCDTQKIPDESYFVSVIFEDPLTAYGPDIAKAFDNFVRENYSVKTGAPICLVFVEKDDAERKMRSFPSGTVYTSWRDQ